MRRSCLLCLLGLMFSAASLAAQEAAAVRANSALRQAVKKHSVPGARVGVVVRRLSDGHQVFSLRGQELMGIASNAKLFTTAAALRLLGPDYNFQTTVIGNGKLENGVFKGDLVIVGGGDPSISGRFHSGEVLYVPRQMASAVRGAGIELITGDLVMDDRFFDRVHRVPGWPKQELLWWYTAPVSALSFNDNCLRVHVSGGTQVGSAARVIASPFPYGIFANQCTTVGTRDRAGVTFLRAANGATVVKGKIRSGQSRSENITVLTPPLYLGKAIREALAKQGVQVSGKTRLVRENENVGASARTIFVWNSKLTDAIRIANQRSQNFYAEQILKTLAAERGGTGTFENGTKAVLAFAESIGLARGTVTLADGCGLSPGNQATPRAVVSLLDVMYRSKLKDIFYNSLAVNGKRATTLRSRLTETAFRGRIHAKTGTIKSRGISALSGYAEAHDGATYAFSILVNGFQPGAFYRARNLENALCRALIGVPAASGRKKGGNAK